MNKMFYGLLIAAGLGFATVGSVAAATNGHDSHSPSHTELTLNNGQKWLTDDALRTGMENIRGLMTKALPQIHDGRLDKAGYGKLAGDVSGWIDYMVANCKLPPEVDAQLHVVLEQIIEGVEHMEAKATPINGAIKVVGAIDLYGRHFDHPGWQPLDH